MKRLQYEVTVYTSKMVADHTFFKDFDSEEHAESFRKNYEAELGFSVSIKFVKEVETEKLGDSYVSKNSPSNNVELSDTTFNPELTRIKSLEEDPSTFPRGWHRKKLYVSPKGNVYHQGTLQPNLMGNPETQEVI